MYKINKNVENIIASNNSKYATINAYSQCNPDEYYYKWDYNKPSINWSIKSIWIQNNVIKNKCQEIVSINGDNLLVAGKNLIGYNDTNNNLTSKKFTVNHEEKNHYAVQLRNTNFAYEQLNNSLFSPKNNKKILENCTINVPKGHIYALLGPSGCGKTTLLKCFLGRLKPESGVVSVFGQQPNMPSSNIPGSGVGYMPQNLSLIGEFTIGETLNYFGSLHRMPQELINSRIDLLLSVLHLPPKSSLISHLSGGQQRRVSLSVALLHQPPLYILDEPTVGVDPLLRQEIWLHLEKLCREDGLTVIFTTHYIEEARNAAIVGFMRNGRLLSEENPEILIQKHGARNLEDVFLKLCQLSDICLSKEIETEPQNNEINQQTSFDLIHSQKNYNNHSKNLKNTTNNRYMDWARIRAQIQKNWVKIRGNRALLLMIFLPSLHLSFFCASVGRDPQGINVAVVNKENPPFLTSLFLDSLNNNLIRQVPYPTIDSACESVINGSTWAVIFLAANYSESLKERLTAGANVDNDVIKGSSVLMVPNMSNAIIGGTLLRSISLSWQKFVQNYLTVLGYNPSVVSVPVQVHEVVYGHEEQSMTDFMAPGVIQTTIFFAPFVLTIFTLIKEKLDGFLERSIISGVGPWEIMFSHFIIQTAVLTIQVVLMIFTSFYIWKIPNYGTLWEASAIIFFQGVAGVALGLLISASCDSLLTGLMVGFAIILPTWVTCGMIWPLESIPSIWQTVIKCLPLTLPVEAMRCIISRGWNYTYNDVMLGYFVSIIYTIIFFVLAVIVFKYRVKV